MPRGRHRHSPPLHRLLPPSAIAGVSLLCAAGPWLFSDAWVLRGLAAGAAATAVVGAVVMRHWDVSAGKRVADLTRARASDEWRHEERVAELETDLDESRELRTKLEHRLREKRAELQGLRNEHAALLRRYATAETERASVLESRRRLAIESTTPARALPAAASADPVAEATEKPAPAARAAASVLYAKANAALDRLAEAATTHVDVAEGEPWTDGAPKDEAAKDGSAEGSSPEDAAATDASATEASAKDEATKDDSAEDGSAEGSSPEDAAATGTSATEASAKEASAQGASATGVAATDVSAQDVSATDAPEPDASEDANASSALDSPTDGAPAADTPDGSESPNSGSPEGGSASDEPEPGKSPKAAPAKAAAKSAPVKPGAPKSAPPAGGPGKGGPPPGGSPKGGSRKKAPATGEAGKEGEATQGKPQAVGSHERTAAAHAPTPAESPARVAAPTPAETPAGAAAPAPAASSTTAADLRPAHQAGLPSGHFTVPKAVAVVPASPVRRPSVEGGFDFFGTQQEASRAALESVQNEDLADVVGQEALALHKAESEAQFKPADEESRGVGQQVIDLTAHDETEQIDVAELRSAVS
ncbi:hypothetical protein [Streptomyces sp. NBC_00286]|uniref:hypothetical protein n=1 Tax=Streptomyces sp. NBC_00286 TaxID=2975701 RepID=UPI002E29642C|nr:hypothetical protein [Streptomyces sp. NBC_00286]